MKRTLKLSITLLTAATAALAGRATEQTKTQTIEDEITVARSALKADRKATVAEAMQFTAQQAEAFWPLYQQYRAEMDKSGDLLLKLVTEYSQLYPNVPDDRAKVMLTDLGQLQKQRVDTRNSYLKKIEKVLAPAKTLRFAQVESRLDLALQIQLASHIPLVPIEGRMMGETGAAAGIVEGVPGASTVQTYELKARVAAIDKATRKVTLVDAAGIKTTVKVAPEAVNFDQIHVGDKLKITASEELVIFVAGEGEPHSDGGVQLVAVAPEGAKPGGMMVETRQVTAKVTALDSKHRKATLQFEDGTTHTVAVRPDVDISKRKVGDQVVIRTTESLAIRIVKP